MQTHRLRDVAHCRVGDKGATLIISVIFFRPDDYFRCKELLSPSTIGEHLGPNNVLSATTRWLETLRAVQIVCQRADGDVTTSLAQDQHGKSLSGLMLDFPLVDDPRFPGAGATTSSPKQASQE